MKGKIKVKNYSLEKTLESGQAFRWRKLDTGIYIGVIGGSVVILRQLDGGIRYKIVEGDLNQAQLEHYLAVDDDYNDILAKISTDDNVKKALKIYNGYRILRQPPFETLISFLDSSTNTITNIKNVIDNMACMFGKRINQEFCQFPSLERIANLSEAQIKKAKVGFRGKYMIDTSKKLLKKSQKGEEFFSRLEKLDSSHAHKELKNFYGVGDKIADCFLLFSFHRLERVPIDVWTKRILQDMYSLDPDKKYSTLQDKIYQIHGEYSGYAFSFLFEYIRNNGERS